MSELAEILGIPPEPEARLDDGCPAHQHGDKGDERWTVVKALWK